MCSAYAALLSAMMKPLAFAGWAIAGMTVTVTFGIAATVATWLIWAAITSVDPTRRYSASSINDEPR